jgi:ERCC4-type nuclease
LPVGDGIWIARHKKNLTEYVLDFIVERKNVADLGSSIRDNRYKDQKTRLQVLFGLSLTTCYCLKPEMFISHLSLSSV